MPVGYSDRFFRLALHCFLNQTYRGPVEIVVLDNSDQSIEHLLPDDKRIKYHLCQRMPVGALRNLGTTLATGDICITGDEDDWSSPDRVSAQVARLQETGKAVTGWHNIFYHDAETDECLKYRFERAGIPHIPYACGTSQVYLRTWWEKHPFPSTGVEDYAFQKAAQDAKQLDSTDAEGLCVARAHRDSKCPIGQYRGSRQFQLVPPSSLPPKFFADLKGEQEGAINLCPAHQL
jgi:glycosyltransferase involved in cell wall biosynthesis